MEFSNAQKTYLSQKTYHLTLVTYLDVTVISSIISSCSHIKKFAYCLHDKDGVKNHTHVLLSFTSDQTLLKYAKLFETTEITSLSKGDLPNLYNYLIHSTPKCISDGKYLYDKNERITNDEDYFLSVSNFSHEKLDVNSMLHDVLRLTRRQFVIRYGFNALLNYDKIYQFSRACEFEEAADLDARLTKVDPLMLL